MTSLYTKALSHFLQCSTCSDKIQLFHFRFRQSIRYGQKTALLAAPGRGLDCRRPDHCHLRRPCVEAGFLAVEAPWWAAGNPAHGGQRRDRRNQCVIISLLFYYNFYFSQLFVLLLLSCLTCMSLSRSVGVSGV